jgi:SAM-dependent methyltransferase
MCMDTHILKHATYKEFIESSFSKIPEGLIVADVACGPGNAGAELLRLNSKFVNFIDARTESFDEAQKNWNADSKFSNYSFNQVDIENKFALSKSIAGSDVIIYTGHLYHSINPGMILDAITKSSAKYLVIESKMNNPDFFLVKSERPRIVKVLNNTEYYYSAWAPGDPKMIEVCQPNLAFTKKFLEDANWKIEEWFDKVEDVPGVENMRPDMKMQRYGFFCTR